MKLPKNQQLYTKPITKLPKIRGRRTGAVKAPMDKVKTPLDRIMAPSAYPKAGR